MSRAILGHTRKIIHHVSGALCLPGHLCLAQQACLESSALLTLGAAAATTSHTLANPPAILPVPPSKQILNSTISDASCTPPKLCQPRPSSRLPF